LTLFKTGTYTDSMSEPRFFRAVVLLGALALTTPGRVSAQANERAMYVSVVNDAGAPVLDLGVSDFVIREDRVEREVLRVAPAAEPMQIEILVDNSDAAQDYIRDIRAALPAFIDALATPNEGGRRNEIGLIALADRPTILTPSTFDAAQLKKGVDRIFAQNESANYLLDGIIEVCKGFKKRGAARPVIIAITTEGPEYSSQHFDLVLGPLHDTGAAFHVIAVGPLSNDTSDESHNRGTVLDRGPSSTGGRFEHLFTSMGLAGKLTQIANELTHQYRVTYARPQSLIPPDTTTVSVSKPGLTARGTAVKAPQGRQ
jgi:hypothetical protein